jgi:hypothetical protein
MQLFELWHSTAYIKASKHDGCKDRCAVGLEHMRSIPPKAIEQIENEAVENEAVENEALENEAAFDTCQACHFQRLQLC